VQTAVVAAASRTAGNILFFDIKRRLPDQAGEKMRPVYAVISAKRWRLFLASLPRSSIQCSGSDT
jgi:hypothetical protein